MQRWGMHLVLCVGVSLLPVAWGADPSDRLKQFSDIQHVDLKRLFDGEILAERGSLMNFPNGISAQTCFVVPTTPEETARRLQTWNPSRYPALGVFAFHELHQPCAPADFAGLNLVGKERPNKWLLDKTLATSVGKSELNLSRSEAGAIAGCVGLDRTPQGIGACWARLLLERATAFQRDGFSNPPPYEVAGQIVSPVAQLHSMVLEQPAISREFAPVLKASGLLVKGGGGTLTPFYYWDHFEADHHATLSLGARYQLAVDERVQLLDVEYYVSGNYYTSAALYEVWPVSDGERTGSLVWRGDFFAAPMLSFTKGTERIAYGVIMVQEIKQEIRCFQDELKEK
jgi:hypothetical protein